MTSFNTRIRPAFPNEMPEHPTTIEHLRLCPSPCGAADQTQVRPRSDPSAVVISIRPTVITLDPANAISPNCTHLPANAGLFAGRGSRALAGFLVTAYGRIEMTTAEEIDMLDAPNGSNSTTAS